MYKQPGIQNLAHPTFFDKFERLFSRAFSSQIDNTGYFRALIDDVRVSTRVFPVAYRIGPFDVVLDAASWGGLFQLNRVWIEGLVCWYSVERSDEFKAVNGILYNHELVLKAFDTPVIIVGVKPTDESERQVSIEEGMKLALRHRAPFYEIDEDEEAAMDILYEMIRCMKQPRHQSCLLVRFIV